MPDLILSEDRKQYQDLAADFAANELAPRAHDCDKTGKAPLDVLKQAWDIGLLSLRLPETAGGLGLGIGDTAVVVEQLAAGCAGISSAIWGSELAVSAALSADDKQQQTRLLEPLAAEFALAGFAFPSPDQQHQIRCREDGNKLVLNGSCLVLNAGNARWIAVSAYGSDGRQLTHVLAVGANHPAMELSPASQPIGLKAADLQTATFNSLELTGDDVLLGTKNGDNQWTQFLASAAIILGSCATGILSAALRNSVGYSKERHTMGVPIAQHQAVGFMLADMARHAEGARFLLHKAAWLVDNSQPERNSAALAKNYALDAAMKGTTDAVQIYGGYGYSKEYPVEKLMRDAKMLQVLSPDAANERIEAALSMVAASS